MHPLRRWAGLALAAVVLAALTPAPAAAQAEAGMPNFRSDAELVQFLAARDKEGNRALRPPPPPPPPAPPPPMTAGAAGPPPAADNPAITSTQVVGVDEGGIVKVSGDHLVILRRGRLFTVSTAGGDLQPADRIEAYPPGVSPRNDWYDEMLVKGDLIVVVGFSYARGGTEVNRFRIAPDGKLSFVDSHHLRSDDYYSSRNYASRLIGDQLVVYSPLRFRYGDPDDVLDALPGMRRWRGDAGAGRWVRTADARRVYVPAPMKRRGPVGVEAMHTVTRCDVTAPELACVSTAVLGPSGRTFFVSRNAIYVWVTPAWAFDDWDARDAFLYRIPFDGSRPAAVQVRGAPMDQFSFNANERLGRLEVLLTGEGGGDEMWAPEFASGRPALLTLPTGRFGDGSGAAPKSDYRFLPGEKGAHLSRNRFVGEQLLYGLGRFEGQARSDRLVVVPVEAGEPVVMPLPFPITRLEQLGRDGLVVGGTEEAVFLTVDLTPGQAPRLGSRFAQPNSREAEGRSQAFFYRPDSDDGAAGLLGLPVLRLGGGQWLADMLFLRRTDGELSDFGLLRAEATPGGDDGCQASCVDWYGNARPIFLRGRVFALLGYELVEGDDKGERIREVRRVSYAPGR